MKGTTEMDVAVALELETLDRRKSQVDFDRMLGKASTVGLHYTGMGCGVLADVNTHTPCAPHRSGFLICSGEHFR